MLLKGITFSLVCTNCLHSVCFAEIMANVRHDAIQIRMAFQTLFTNQNQTSIWIGQIMDGVVEMTVKVFNLSKHSDGVR